LTKVGVGVPANTFFISGFLARVFTAQTFYYKTTIRETLALKSALLKHEVKISVIFEATLYISKEFL